MKKYLLIILFASCIKITKNESKMRPVKCLDKIESDIIEKGYMYFLPDNPNTDYIGSRCHIFFDENDWLICFETVTYGIGNAAVISELLFFSSNDSVTSGTPINIKYEVLSDDDNLKHLFGDQLDEELQNSNTGILINKCSIALGNKDSISEYIKNKVPEYGYNEISPTEVMRFLIDTKPNSVFLTNEQLKKALGTSMEKKLQINEWYHTDVYCESKGESNLKQNDFLKNIANVIDNKSINLFINPLKTNTDWKFHFQIL